MRKILISILLSVSLCFSIEAETNPGDTLSADRAIEYYKSILKKNKKSAFANTNLASVYFVKNDYNASLKYSKRATKEKSEFQADAYIVYGSSLDRLGRIKEAIETFEEAILLFPNNYMIQYQCGLSYYKYRKHDKAIKKLEKVITLQPLYIPAHYLYGCSLFEGSNNVQCINAFLYGLMLDNDSMRSVKAIAFVTTYMNHKPENILIPFFDKRYAVSSIEDILEDYFPAKSRVQVFSNFNQQHYVSMVTDLIKPMKPCNLETYDQLFHEIEKNGHTSAFAYYTLRKLKNEYVNQWYIQHSKELESFASFLEKALPSANE